jgi:hypothetical protein
MPRWRARGRVDEASFIGALLTQLGFFAIWGVITDGCFCSVTGSPTPDPAPPYLVTAIRVLTFPGGALGPVPYVPEAVSYVALVTLNLLVWYAGFAIVRAGAARVVRSVRPRAIG